jgi:hypothetical protein
MNSRMMGFAGLLGVAGMMVGGCGGGASRGGGWGEGAVTEHRAMDADGKTVFSAPPMPAPNAQRAASGAPGVGYWQQRADYVIEATLDAPKREVTANETITYTNNSPDELRCVWMNLEQNLFRADSDGALLTKPNARFGNRDKHKGGFTFERVAVNGAPVKMLEYGTVGRIDLAKPLVPGGKIEISAWWSFPVPKYGSDRMGISECKDGDVFEIAQWFPSVCVYDDVNGWNTLPYLGQGEFYTDFGDYEVSITVPANHVVAGCGELANAAEVLSPEMYEKWKKAKLSGLTVMIRSGEEASAGKGESGREETKKWVFNAPNVRTFAWASSSAFIWDGCAAIIPEKGKGPPGGLGGEPVFCQSFYPKEAKPAWSPDTKAGGSSQFLKASVEHYSKMWLAYPYTTASNINGVVGGMEYPGLAMCGARDDSKGLWGVTTHEIGHTWFPMTVSTNERQHAWMDEGFNTFMNYYATKERYPDNEPHRGGPARFAKEQPHSLAAPIMMMADQYPEGTLGELAYDKTSTGLVLLRETILGHERFDAAFREYCRRWAFKHPYPADFFRTMENMAGMDLGWFWRGWFYGTGVLDQAVTTVMQPSEGGEKDKGFARVTFVQRGGPGHLVMPVYYRITLEDGKTEDRHVPVEGFFGSDAFTAVIDTRGKKITSVEVDHDVGMPDVDRSNNTWKR